MFRQSFKKVLSNSFPTYAIDEAVDAVEAMEKMESFRPELIFMDVRLPGENGIKLTRRIKARYPEPVVIIHTSYDLPEYRDAAIQAGASHFITKGLLAEKQIKALVESVLENSKTPKSE